MAHFIHEIRSKFEQKDILMRLIIINVSIFIILNLVYLVNFLFKIVGINIIEYIGTSSELELVMNRPWTVLTYMFVHVEIFHILFNMLMLYWFGKLFLTYFSSKSLGGLYILGGIAGALIYLLAYNTIPGFIDKNQSLLIGASGSVMAIIFAAAFYNPKQEIRLLFIGEIKIIYFALFLFVIDFIMLRGDNAGGHVAHIGGAMMGYVFAKQYQRGKDMTKWISSIFDWFANHTKRNKFKKPKFNHTQREADYEYNKRKHNDGEEIDKILDKIKSSGYSSLNKDEKKRLFDAGQK